MSLTAKVWQKQENDLKHTSKITTKNRIKVLQWPEVQTVTWLKWFGETLIVLYINKCLQTSMNCSNAMYFKLLLLKVVVLVIESHTASAFWFNS